MITKKTKKKIADATAIANVITKTPMAVIATTDAPMIKAAADAAVNLRKCFVFEEMKIN